MDTTSSVPAGKENEPQQQKQPAKLAQLPNRPETKMAPIPKGSRIHKRPLPSPSPSQRPSTKPLLNTTTTTTPQTDPDGYLPPPRASHTVVIKVTATAPFMALVKRVRKALDDKTASTTNTAKGLPLTARITALRAQKDRSGADADGGVTEDALDDVVLIGTGRAIQKAVEVGGFFTREKDLIVVPRTRTLAAIDDIVMGEEEREEDDRVRIRQVSCLEVGIRWRSG
ncbi:Rpp20 subunit of nuclear RNase MRP and P-domain-containing protein [Bombardia bombarda]|uniref:Rpp20 subunit of nuclear RNase MRP and P-domain-containing protein n=1 Tax=Bombardia bombarda TaxID=252184 RepID=A0AA39TM82_9PEZI|nr:Rpp20 subunit of nuclear RNase MRP and P-domain-containing protein [Bombardia bombarda]